jgi:hypothetical protein
MTSDQQFILALIAAIGTLAASMAAVFVQLRSLKVHVNSRMDQLLELTRSASKAEGNLAGRAGAAAEQAGTSGPAF